MKRKLTQVIVGLALVAGGLAVVPQSVQSAVAAPVVAGPTEIYWARVSQHADGDTFAVAWEPGYEHPQGKNTIRFVGVDANEVSSDQCLADEASDFVKNLLPLGTLVRLEAEHFDSEASGRLLRHVFVGDTNVSVAVIEAGLGLPASYDVEPAYRDDYFAAGEWASVAQVGMWAPAACGGNPTNWPELEVVVTYDAPGTDDANPNGETILIRNHSAGAVNVGNWTYRKSARNLGGQNLGVKTIPAGTTIPGHGELLIRVGSGTNTSSTIYMGEPDSWFSNDTDVLYLRDTVLNMRGFHVWPCTVTCGEMHSVVIEALNYDPPGVDDANPNGEWLTVRNVGDGSVDLSDWKLWDNGYHYYFRDGEVLGEGKTLNIRIGQGTDSGNTRYWGNNKSVLGNSGGAITVRSPRNVGVDCFSWGDGSCPGEHVRGAIQLTAHYDAKGKDATHPNREWISLANTSDSNVNISKHRVWVGQLNYRFPKNTIIKPGKRLRLRIGSGSNTTKNHYWGNAAAILPNSNSQVQLRDPGGTVLLEHGWKCADCGPDGPFVIDRVKYNAPGNDRTNPNGEWIAVRNSSSERASLRDYMIKVGKKQYLFLTNVWLKPGATLKLRIGKGTDTAKTRYWGRSSDILRNKGKKVTLHSPHREVVGCHAWGDITCPPGQQSVSAGLKITINYDAEGDDNINLNGEWVDLRNISPSTLSLDGFALTSDGQTYEFDSGDVIPPGKRLRIHSGEGTDSGLTRYAGDDLQAFANTHDEVTLLNEQGQVSKFYSY